jgi:hypothetical protein
MRLAGRVSPCIPPSQDLTRRGCLDITRVRRPGRLNEEHVRLYFRKGLVLHTARNDEQLPWIENHRSIAQTDLEPSGQHEEKIIGLVVFMPHEFALHLYYHDVEVVQLSHCAGFPVVREQRQLLSEIDRGGVRMSDFHA